MKPDYLMVTDKKQIGNIASHATDHLYGDVELLLRGAKNPDEAKKWPAELTSSLENFLLHRGVLFLALLDRRTVGMATLVPSHEMTGVVFQLRHLLVLPKYGDEGIAKGLLLEVIKAAGDKHIPRITLTLESPHDAGNRIYTAAGFEKCEGSLYCLNIKQPV